MSILEAKDSILEQAVINSSKELISMHHMPPAGIVNMLVTSYCGYPNLCKILLSAVARAHSISMSINDNSASADASFCLNTSREILAGILSKRFDRNVAEDMILTFTSTPQWLNGLLRDPLFRATVIKLHEKNGGSALLDLCIRQISLLGYHSEIKLVAAKSDFFVVFSNSLHDLMAKVSSIPCLPAHNPCGESILPDGGRVLTGS
jgi:hypothetical protein